MKTEPFVQIVSAQFFLNIQGHPAHCVRHVCGTPERGHILEGDGHIFGCPVDMLLKQLYLTI